MGTGDLHDNARNRISTTDGDGNTTKYQYDARKRLTETGRVPHPRGVFVFAARVGYRQLPYETLGAPGRIMARAASNVLAIQAGLTGFAAGAVFRNLSPNIVTKVEVSMEYSLALTTHALSIG